MISIDNIIASAIEVLSTAGIKFVGYYPEDVPTSIGQNTPCAIIRIDSEDSFDTSKTGTYFSSMRLKIYLYTSVNQNIALDMTRLQNKLIDAFLSDLSMNESVHCVTPVSINRGDRTDSSIDYYNEGYYDGLNVGSVDIDLELCR